MPKYRKKPVVIEAYQFTDETKDQVANWVTCNCYPDWNAEGKPILVIGTLEGDMAANFGDYVIKGVLGEFYPCKAEVFDLTYEAVK